MTQKASEISRPFAEAAIEYVRTFGRAEEPDMVFRVGEFGPEIELDAIKMTKGKLIVQLKPSVSQ